MNGTRKNYPKQDNSGLDSQIQQVSVYVWIFAAKSVTTMRPERIDGDEGIGGNRQVFRGK